VYKQLCVFSPLCTTLRPEDGRARPKHVVTIGNKIQNQDSFVFRRTPPPSFDLHKHNGDDEPEDHPNRVLKFHFLPTKATSYFPKHR
jgi:hypothetical protein